LEETDIQYSFFWTDNAAIEYDPYGNIRN